MSHAQNSVVVAKGVQTGTVVFGTGTAQVNSNTTTVTLGQTVDDTKAFVQCVFSTTQNNENVRPTCELTSTTLVISIGSTIAAAAHTTVRWYVVEFEGNVTVKRGLAVFTTNGADGGTASTEPWTGSGTTTGTIAIGTTVDCTKSFVVTSERIPLAAATSDFQVYSQASLVTTSSGSAPRNICTAGTTNLLELFRTSTSAVNTPLKVAWQVVQIEGISVQRGRVCIGGTGGTTPCSAANGAAVTASVTTVTPSKAFIRTTRRLGTGVNQKQLGLTRVDLNSGGTQLTFTRGSSSTANNVNVLLTWELVAFLDTGTVTVERNTAGSDTVLNAGTASGSGNTNAANFSVAVTQARVVPFISTSYNNASTAETNSSLQVQVNGSNLSFTRTGTTGALTIDWQAVQFFGCDTDATLCHVSASALTGTTSNSATATLTWWPSYYANSAQCFVASTTSTTPTQGPVCNVLVVRTADGSTPNPTLTNGTNITLAAGTLIGGGSCTRTGSTAGTSSNPCIVFNQSSSGATTGTATDNYHSGGSGLANDGSTTYTYRVYVKGGTTTTCTNWPCWVSPSTSLSQVSVTPKMYSASTGGMKWVYAASGGATLNSPIEDFGASNSARVFANSSNHKFLSIDTNTGSELSLPVTTVGAGLGYASWWPPAPPGTRASQVVIGDQKGYVTSFDGNTGQRIWTRKVHTDASDASGNADVDSAVSVQMRQFSNAAFNTAYPLVGGETSYDVVFAATKNATSGGFNQNNKIYALKSTDGTLLWTYDPNSTSVCNPAKPMDIVPAQVAVDYNLNRLIITTEDGFSTAQNSLWIISSLGPTGSGGSSTCNGMLVASFGSLRDIDTSLWQNYNGNTFYFQNSDCALYARDTATGSTGISDSTVVSSNTSDAAPGCLIKNSVWQDYNKYQYEGTTRLYFVTQNGGVWCVDEIPGVDFDLCTDWPTNPVYIHSGPTLNGNSSGATPLGAPMLLEPHFWAGGQSGGTGNFGQGVLFQISTVNGSLEKTYTVDSSTNLGDLSTSTTADALYVGTNAGRLYRINLNGVYGSLP